MHIITGLQPIGHLQFLIFQDGAKVLLFYNLLSEAEKVLGGHSLADHQCFDDGRLGFQLPDQIVRLGDQPPCLVLHLAGLDSGEVVFQVLSQHILVQQHL